MLAQQRNPRGKRRPTPRMASGDANHTQQEGTRREYDSWACRARFRGRTTRAAARPANGPATRSTDCPTPCSLPTWPARSSTPTVPRRGYSAFCEELIGLNQAALYPPQLAQHSDACFQRRQRKTARRGGNTWSLRPDGTAVPVEVHAQPHSWCGVDVMALTVRDAAMRGGSRRVRVSAHRNVL